MRIYKDYPRVVMVALLRSLLDVARYFFLNLLPMAVFLPFLVLIFFQMDIRFGRRPFVVGESIQLYVHSQKGIDPAEIGLETGMGFEKVMAPVVMPGESETDWKIRAKSEGLVFVKVVHRNKADQFGIWIGPGFPPQIGWKGPLSMKNFFRQLVDPSIGFLFPDSPYRFITLDYSRRALRFGSISLSWIWIYLVVILILVLLGKKRFGVEF